MVDQLTPDPKHGIAFLQWLNPKAPIYLEAHESVGAARPRSKEYPHDFDDDAQRFVTANNNGQRRRNIYFLPNVMLLSGSRAKANISASQFLWVDLDCKDYPGSETEQREAILRLLLDRKLRPAGVPEPTAFWFTGGGYQAIWRMSKDITVEEAESHNRALLIAYRAKGGPIDASRLLRLPGTVNWLSETKRAAGRQPAMAFLFEPVAYIAAPVTYTLSDFRLRLEKPTNVANIGTANSITDLEGIEPLPLPDDRGEVIPLDPVWANAIVTGRNPPDKNYPSRSELVFAATLWLLGNGVTPGHALSILTSPDLGISAHVLENPNPLRYAKRQVTRALQTIDLRAKGWPKVDQDGRPAANSAENVRYALAMLDVDARRNTFTHEDEVTGLGLEGRDITDISDILCSMFGRKLDFRCSVTVIRRELITIAYERQYHPVIDYLDGLVWDGTPRLATWLRDYCRAEDSELNSEFGTKFLIAGVRRIKDPGVKFDNMLVLEGKQGAGKSRLAARLAVRDEWFCGNLNLNADAKTKAELVSRAWIVECQELDGARKATLDAIKAFLATPIDTYRRAYAHNAGSYPRHCVIIGTTNEDAYLRDVTGNRRYWPVRVGTIDIEAFGRDVHQLWAEAAVREKAGESIVLSPRLWKAADELQSSRMIDDPIAGALEGEFGERTGRVSMESVKLLLGHEPGRMSAGEFQRVQHAMTALGWNYGTHRLHDLGVTGKSARKGFARAIDDKEDVEWVARRGEGGIVSLRPVQGTAVEPPF